MIWGTDVLKNRSVTGVATKKKKDAIPKPPLSPHKLSIVRGSTPSGSAVLGVLSFTLLEIQYAGFSAVNDCWSPRMPGPNRSIGADIIAVTRDLTLDRTNESGHKYNARVWLGMQGGQTLCWGLSEGRIPARRLLDRAPSVLIRQRCRGCGGDFWRQKHLEQGVQMGKGCV